MLSVEWGMVIFSLIVTSIPTSIKALLKPYSLTSVTMLLDTVPINENRIGMLVVRLTIKPLWNKEPIGISQTTPSSRKVSLVPFKESDNSISVVSPF